MSSGRVSLKIDVDVSRFSASVAALGKSMRQASAEIAYGGAAMAFLHLQSLVTSSSEDYRLDALTEARDRYYLRRDLLELA